MQPISQIVAMAKRLQETEEIIANLQKSEINSAKSLPETNHSIHSDVTVVASPAPLQDMETESTPTQTAYDSSCQLQRAKRVNSNLTIDEPLLSDLSLDENGKILS